MYNTNPNSNNSLLWSESLNKNNMKITSIESSNSASKTSESNESSKKRNISLFDRIKKISSMDIPKLLRNMRIINISLSLIQIIAGITGITSFITLNITGTLISFYVIMFGFIFLLFECRLSRMENKIRKNFGFLYSYKGRASFIFFIGFMDFGMNTNFGYLTGICMCLNSIFNFYVMLRHPEFRSGNIKMTTDPTLSYKNGNDEANVFLKKNHGMFTSIRSYIFEPVPKPDKMYSNESTSSLMYT